MSEDRKCWVAQSDFVKYGLILHLKKEKEGVCKKMAQLLESIPVNHWSTVVIFGVMVVSFFYILYYFFSQEGRDERGRGIFAKASMITFIVTVILLILASYYTDLFLISGLVTNYLITLMTAIICITQVGGIWLFKRFS